MHDKCFKYCMTIKTIDEESKINIVQPAAIFKDYLRLGPINQTLYLIILDNSILQNVLCRGIQYWLRQYPVI